ncbi:MAG TPA: NADH-quinone oxidoreductase subunit H [Anaeromyxobacteraceae bacterium]|nr:NADH-quinone oxidoreductase subunit H [Anaeromyxobacteraceae bacterium]
MSALLAAAHLAALLLLPFPLVGIVNRTRARFAGRKGPRLWQTFDDLRRLLGKRPVYSRATTVLFRAAPLVLLASTLLSGLFVPLLGAAPASFDYDFVLLAYLWGLGRLALVLAALDTGSSFEGMGASREAAYAALLEPALFLALGTLAAASGHASLAGLLEAGLRSPAEAVTGLGALVALAVLLQVEAGRVPIDDPSTHLELTMIHEVMILDHAGPDLAAVQYAAALKLTLCASLVAGLVDPLHGAGGAAAAAARLALTAAVAVAVGCAESLVARLRLKAVPQYLLVAGVAGAVALLATAWRQGGGQ